MKSCVVAHQIEIVIVDGDEAVFVPDLTKKDAAEAVASSLGGEHFRVGILMTATKELDKVEHENFTDCITKFVENKNTKINARGKTGCNRPGHRKKSGIVAHPKENDVDDSEAQCGTARSGDVTNYAFANNLGEKHLHRDIMMKDNKEMDPMKAHQNDIGIENSDKGETVWFDLPEADRDFVKRSKKSRQLQLKAFAWRDVTDSERMTSEQMTEVNGAALEKATMSDSVVDEYEVKESGFEEYDAADSGVDEGPFRDTEELFKWCSTIG
jgi:hypothetical protein